MSGACKKTGDAVTPAGQHAEAALASASVRAETKQERSVCAAIARESVDAETGGADEEDAEDMHEDGDQDEQSEADEEGEDAEGKSAGPTVFVAVAYCPNEWKSWRSMDCEVFATRAAAEAYVARQQRNDESVYADVFECPIRGAQASKTL